MSRIAYQVFFIFLIFLFSGLFYYSVIPTPVYYAEKMLAKIIKVEPETPPILFTGDIMLGRNVEKLMNSQNGFDPFGDTTLLLESHVTISNLEGAIPKEHEQTPSNGFSFSFPSNAPIILREHGIKAVSLANNHMYDQGKIGYEQTKIALDKENIFHFGAYDTTSLDYFETNIGSTTVIVYGINTVSNTWNEARAHEVTKMLRQSHPDAYLIAYIHWGNEYALKQNGIQREFAHKLIDEGVNAIVGSHPHVVEGIELYNSAVIFYSLGNFIFDQYFSQDTQQGYVLSLDIKENQVIYKIIPIMSKMSKTKVADDGALQNILETIAKSSPLYLQKSIKAGEIILPVLW